MGMAHKESACVQALFFFPKINMADDILLLFALFFDKKKKITCH